MTDPGVDRTYVLPQEESDLLFEQIAQTLLAGAVPQVQPVATVLSAPPGAGKTVLAQDIRATYPEGAQPVVIDVDAVRHGCSGRSNSPAPCFIPTRTRGPSPTGRPSPSAGTRLSPSPTWTPSAPFFVISRPWK
ncbi:zeta toxin family protein [Streptomyces sp. NPDC059999]|uniref:zeta toxin family protein n=1 Tax=Streptomyces sp. NPDC059999 TaxID=3347030 RepID=UPI0036BC3F2A